MNNKGFMMAEVIVVSAIVLATITGLFTSYNKLYSKFKERITYYDNEVLYELAYYRDYLIETKDSSGNKKIYTLFNDSNNIVDLKSSDYLNITDNDKIKIYSIKSPNNNLESLKSDSLNTTFNNYIDYLINKVSFDGNYALVMEKCDSVDKCYYAYLELYSE